MVGVRCRGIPVCSFPVVGARLIHRFTICGGEGGVVMSGRGCRVPSGQGRGVPAFVVVAVGSLTLGFWCTGCTGGRGCLVVR